MGIPRFTDDFPINISISREFPSQSRWMTPEGYFTNHLISMNIQSWHSRSCAKSVSDWVNDKVYCRYIELYRGRRSKASIQGASNKWPKPYTFW